MSTYLNHEKIVAQAAKDFEDQGYAVVLLPSAGIIPFSLEGYTPDLLATKGNEHLLIEIKGRSPSPEQARRYRKVIDIIEAHPGWRFVLKTVADLDQTRGIAPESIGIDAIESYVSKVDQVIKTGPAELALPYLWNAVIALLRHKAALAHLPFDELTDRSLLNQLYTLGVISGAQYEKMIHWLHLRNSTVHSISFAPTFHDVTELSTFSKSLIEDLKHAVGRGDEGDRLSSATV